jgi:CheY-like chemotaxis protein
MDVLRRLKEDPRTQSIHVVVLTVTRNDASIAQAMGLGAAAYIVKPVEFLGLSEIVPKLSLRWALVETAGLRS